MMVLWVSNGLMMAFQ